MCQKSGKVSRIVPVYFMMSIGHKTVEASWKQAMMHELKTKVKFMQCTRLSGLQNITF